MVFEWGVRYVIALKGVDCKLKCPLFEKRILRQNEPFFIYHKCTNIEEEEALGERNIRIKNRQSSIGTAPVAVLSRAESEAINKFYIQNNDEGMFHWVVKEVQRESSNV